jgi:hypothetical protein
METYELKCFGAGPGHGNSALVVLGGPASPPQRQAFATAANKSA